MAKNQIRLFKGGKFLGDILDGFHHPNQIAIQVENLRVYKRILKEFRLKIPVSSGNGQARQQA